MTQIAILNQLVVGLTEKVALEAVEEVDRMGILEKRAQGRGNSQWKGPQAGGTRRVQVKRPT